jgi:hypothetical protein
MDAVIAQVVASDAPDVNFVGVITWLVHCVEVYSQSVQTGHGSSKLAILRDNIPVFLQSATNAGLCTAQHAAQLHAQLVREWDLVQNIVTALIEVAHNPAFVQIGQKIQSCCAAKWRKRTNL